MVCVQLAKKQDKLMAETTALRDSHQTKSDEVSLCRDSAALLLVLCFLCLVFQVSELNRKVDQLTTELLSARSWHQSKDTEVKLL